MTQLHHRDLDGYEKVYVLNPATDPEDRVELDTRAKDLTMLQGLHAKVYVADAGDEGRIWTGSANATDAAFGGNVEFLVEMGGPRSLCGVEAVLGHRSSAQELEDRNPTLHDLLQEYVRPTEHEPADVIAQEMEHVIDEVRITLATAGLSTRVRSSGEDRRYLVDMCMPTGFLKLPSSVSVICWPISLDETHAAVIDVRSACIAQLGPLTLDAITSFIAFKVTVSQGIRKLHQTFVLNLPLLDAPIDRHDHLLRTLLRDQGQVLRFLLLLLADDQPDIREALRTLDTGRSSMGSPLSQVPGVPFFEVMLRALARSPAKLDTVAAVITELRKAQESADLLPDGFDSIWQPIWAARQRRRG